MDRVGHSSALVTTLGLGRSSAEKPVGDHGCLGEMGPMDIGDGSMVGDVLEDGVCRTCL